MFPFRVVSGKSLVKTHGKEGVFPIGEAVDIIAEELRRRHASKIEKREGEVVFSGATFLDQFKLFLPDPFNPAARGKIRVYDHKGGTWLGWEISYNLLPEIVLIISLLVIVAVVRRDPKFVLALLALMAFGWMVATLIIRVRLMFFIKKLTKRISNLS